MGSAGVCASGAEAGDDEDEEEVGAVGTEAGEDSDLLSSQPERAAVPNTNRLARILFSLLNVLISGEVIHARFVVFYVGKAT